MGLVVLTCFGEAVVCWQEAGAVWIVDGHFRIQLLLLPVWQERQDNESFRVIYSIKLSVDPLTKNILNEEQFEV